MDADLILAGGGLANGLIALALLERRPDVSFLVVEAEEQLGGEHTWSFHAADLAGDGQSAEALVAPLVSYRWPAQQVIFPEFRRRLESGYRTVAAERFNAVLTARLGDRLRLGAPITAVTPTAVRLASGDTLRARGVIDGRGPEPTPHLTLGWQRFLGRELRLEAPHGVREPVIMDATGGQDGAYRFTYLLPFTPDRLLVEDTAYADGPGFDREAASRAIEAYVAARGWRIAEVLRSETGVLPITLAGDPAAFWEAAAGVPRAGLRAGLFHPTTGYSLPEAVRLAERVAVLDDLSADALFAAIRAHALGRWRTQGLYRALNRMLFRATEPERRIHVMQRFYRLPEPLIERFYAGRNTAGDRLRLFTGKPPVPILAAVRAIAEGHRTERTT